MLNLSFLLVVFLLAGKTQINGEVETKSVSELPSYTTTVRTDIKGRLLTPEEGCGYSKVANTRIVGGGPAKNGAWPWMVLLGYGKWYHKFECGGSLITSKHVLTAAHCFDMPITFARLGEYNTATTEDGKHEDIDIARKMLHENYDRHLLINDIAVLELARDVTFNDRISPICLPESGSILSHSLVARQAFVAGWGHLRENTQMTSILQQVQVPVVSNAECKEKYKKVNRFKDDIQFNDNVLCAGYAEGRKDSCHGDSGGPLMIPEHIGKGKFPFYQIGVVAYGYGCGRDVPGVYTNIRSYVDWIQKKLQS